MEVHSLKADTKEHLDFFENCIIGVSFCFTALECFANLTIPDDYVFKYEESTPLFGFHFLKFFEIKRMKSLARDDRRLDLNTKLGIILPEIFNVETPKSKHLWGRYVQLKKMRDKIVHFKKNYLPKSEQNEFNENVYSQFLLGEFSDAYEVTRQLMEYYYQDIEKPDWLN